MEKKINKYFRIKIVSKLVPLLRGIKLDDTVLVKGRMFKAENGLPSGRVVGRCISYSTSQKTVTLLFTNRKNQVIKYSLHQCLPIQMTRGIRISFGKKQFLIPLKNQKV